MIPRLTSASKKGRSLNVPGVTHGHAPIPMGARVGNVIFSSGIMGKDPASDSLPADAPSQVGFAFGNMVALLRAGGATPENLVRLTVYIRDDSLRSAVNEQWVLLFPDTDDRPARHIMKYELPGGMAIQLEAVAVLPDR